MLILVKNVGVLTILLILKYMYVETRKQGVNIWKRNDN